jgi:putative endonuclease
MNNWTTGQHAEQLVARYLKCKGYHIWRTNWRWGRKELDLVARYRGELIIIEVKSRVRNGVNLPSEVVDLKKQRNIVLAAEAFIRLHHCYMPTRFDVIAVHYTSCGAEIEHIENAFFPEVE